MIEKKEKKAISIAISICIHLLIFLLLSTPFMSLQYKNPPEETGFNGKTIPIKFNDKKEPNQENKVNNTVDEITQQTAQDNKKIQENNKTTKIDEQSSNLQENIDNDSIANQDNEELQETNIINEKALFNLKNIKGTKGENKNKGNKNLDGNPEPDPGLGLGWMPSSRNGPNKLECAQNLGEGWVKIETIINASGYIVLFIENTFESSLTQFSFSETNKKNLLECIRTKYRHDPDPKGKEMPDKRFLLELDFKKITQ